MEKQVAIVKGKVERVPQEQIEVMQLLEELPVEVQFRLIVPIPGG